MSQSQHDPRLDSGRAALIAQLDEKEKEIIPISRDIKNLTKSLIEKGMEHGSLAEWEDFISLTIQKYIDNRSRSNQIACNEIQRQVRLETQEQNFIPLSIEVMKIRVTRDFLVWDGEKFLIRNWTQFYYPTPKPEARCFELPKIE